MLFRALIWGVQDRFFEKLVIQLYFSILKRPPEPWQRRTQSKLKNRNNVMGYGQFFR